MEDRQIIELFFARDEDALRCAKDKYEGYLMKVARGLLPNREDCLETVNDTWLKAWKAIPPYRPDNLKAFLAKITRQGAIDLLRKEQSVKRGSAAYTASLDELAEVAAAGSVGEQADAEELAKKIGAWLRTQKPAVRMLFIGRYFYAAEYSALAEKTGMSERRIRVILHRARKKLKHCLEQEGYDL